MMDTNDIIEEILQRAIDRCTKEPMLHILTQEKADDILRRAKARRNSKTLSQTIEELMDRHNAKSIEAIGEKALLGKERMYAMYKTERAERDELWAVAMALECSVDETDYLFASCNQRVEGGNCDNTPKTVLKKLDASQREIVIDLAQYREAIILGFIEKKEYDLMVLNELLTNEERVGAKLKPLDFSA